MTHDVDAGAGRVDVVTREVSRDQDTPLLQQFYDEVMVGAFRPEELGGPYWHDPESAARTVLALDADQQVLGGVVGELFPQSRVLLVSWVAVRRGLRGRRIGSRLMEHIAWEWYGRLGCRLVVGELDDPRYWPSEEQDPVARLRFYDRFGVRALVTPYFQPPVGAGYPPVYHMFLASFDPHAPAVTRDGAGGAVADGQVVRAFIAEYLDSAALLSGHPGVRDADAQWLLSCYPGTDIPLLPLLDYDQIPDTHPPGEGGH